MAQSATSKRRAGDIFVAAVAAMAVVAATLAPSSAGEGSTLGPAPGGHANSVPASSIVIPPESQVLSGLRAGHPRLIVTPDDLPALRQRIATDPTTAAMYAQVRARADALLAIPPVTYTKPDGFRLLEVSREVVRRMYDLGLVWLVEGDTTIAARAWDELAAVSAFSDWNPIHFLDTAEMTHAVAIGYDWLYSYLDASQRATVERALIEKGLTPARDSYAGTAPLLVSYWTFVDNNWNNVVNGGETMGALAIGDIDPQLASYVAREALRRLPVALANYAPDGGWPEGVSYWEYATEYTGYAITGLRSALGTDYGLSDVDGLERTGDVPINMTGPTGQRFNWADDGEPRYAPSVPFLFWLADRFGRTEYRTYELARAAPSALDVVWFNPAASPPMPVPRDRLFRGVDVATMRAAWDDPNAMFAATKGGRPGYNHNQLDAGSFVLDAFGERWAVDLGREDYNVPGYWENQPAGRRWTYYRSRAEGHNTLVLDPDPCEDQDPASANTIVKFAAANDGAFSITDLTNAYRGTPARRGVGLFDRSRVVVQDELRLARETDVWWFMHTRAAIELTDGGRTATLTQNGKTLRATLLAPSSGSFSVVEAAPLPSSPKPSENTPNAGLRKLAVNLRASGQTTISIAFDGGSAALPAMVPLDQWGLAGADQSITTQPPVTTAAAANPCKGIPAPATAPPSTGAGAGQPDPASTSTSGAALPVMATPRFTG